MTGSQAFPEGAKIIRGRCDGFYCRGVTPTAEVVRALVLPFRLTHSTDIVAPAGSDMALCADCLADFAVMNGPDAPTLHAVVVADDAPAEVVNMPTLHVYAEGMDGKFHEVTGELP